MTYKEVQQLVRGFEEGTWPANDWSHFGHFAMALWYIYHYPVIEARKKIKDGIKKYNLSVGGKNTEEEGYHETTTEFYIQVIVRFQLTFIEEVGFEELLSELMSTNIIRKDFPLKFYSKDLLMSRDARTGWEDPDIRSLAFLMTEVAPM